MVSDLNLNAYQALIMVYIVCHPRMLLVETWA